jgi:SAM-dependent methyltransferase
MKDISEYYVGNLAVSEEEAWKTVKLYERNGAEVLKLVNDKGIKRVVEVGCGSGWIPTLLPAHTEYLGIDMNDTFLEWAREKNHHAPNRKFVKEDVRNLNPLWLLYQDFTDPGLVCCFAFMKHFGLHEWSDILKHVLSLATYAAVEVEVTEKEFDNGTDFHHCFVEQSRIDRVLEEVGHKHLYDVVTFDGTCPQAAFKSKIMVTRKK